MTADPAEDSERLLSCVQRALELIEDGAEVDFAKVCELCPELIETVREVVARQRDMHHWAAAEAQRNGLAGRVLVNRYRVDRLIGRGAMGAVYAALDLELKRGVAIKLLQPHLFGAPDAATRFEREAEVLASLNNPHIVGVHDRCTSTDGTHFLVMDLLDGAPLSAVLAELAHRVEADGWEAVRDSAWIGSVIPDVRLPAHSFIRVCALWAADLAAALAAAHLAGIYHRDVKPSNVFVTRDGRALLLDFGIAARDDDATLTRDDATLGTPKYMPPEQAAGSVEPGPSFDVYSLGATLYHMVGGQAPYEGDARAVLLALQSEEPPPVGRRHRALPTDLQAIIECAMARSASRRYGSAALMEADLRAFLDHAPVMARRRGPLRRTWLRARRSRMVQALVLIGIVALLSVAVPAWMRGRDATRQREHSSITAALPPLLTLGRQTVIDDDTERHRVAEMLDRAVTLAPEHVATRCLRASFRLDHGNPDGAAADFAALALAVDTPLTRAVAAARRPSSDGEQPALDLATLPPPERPEDRFVAGYLALRARDVAAARAWLDADPDFLPSRHLRLIPWLEQSLAPRDHASLQLLYDDALELEGVFGRKTTRTRYVLSTVLITAGRNADAIEPLSDVIAQAPRTFGALLNLGIACTATGDHDLAETMLQRALTVRPHDASALNALAKLYTGTDRFEEALETLQRMPDDAAGLRFDAEGVVHRARALRALDNGDDERARELAVMSGAAFKAAAENGFFDRTNRVNMRIAQSIYRGSEERLAKDLLVLLRDDPLNSLILTNVVNTLPLELDANLTEAVRDYFRTLSTDPQRR